MIVNCNIRFIGVNFSIFMYCKIPEDFGTLCFDSRFWFMFIPVFMVWGFVMFADLPMGCIDQLCHVSFLY